MVSCFHSSGLVKEMSSGSLITFLRKSNKIIIINVPNSLRPDLVGVDGSMSGVGLKVTVFAGVRANSLAMNESHKQSKFA